MEFNVNLSIEHDYRTRYAPGTKIEHGKIIDSLSNINNKDQQLADLVIKKEGLHFNEQHPHNFTA